MPDIEIVKLKIRRGPDSQRKLVKLEQGELGYTTDYRRVWVGDGLTTGGNIVGNKIHPPSTKTTINRAAAGDIVYENNKLFQLLGNDPTQVGNWSFIGTQIDSSFFSYDGSNELTLNNNSVTKAQLNADVTAAGGAILGGAGSGLSVSVDEVTITKNANSLEVLIVDENHINTTSFGNGISGGSSDIISLDVNPAQFSFSGNQLQALPQPIAAGSVDVPALSAASIGDGLNIAGDKLRADVRGGDDSTITLDTFNGTMSLSSIGGGSLDTLGTLTYDQYGRVTDTQSSITTSLCAEGNTTSHLSAYNGFIGQTVYTDQTIIDVLSGTNTVSLSSAGFIQVDTSLGVLAIPVFLPPA